MKKRGRSAAQKKNSRKHKVLGEGVQTRWNKVRISVFLLAILSVVGAAAWRDWERLPSVLQKRLQNKLAFYAADPLRYAVKLTNPEIGTYRFRIGEYRIVFDISENTLIVHAVGHRRDIYR